MTLNDIELRNRPYFAFFSPNSTALHAGYVTMVEEGPWDYVFPSGSYYLSPFLMFSSRRSVRTKEVQNSLFNFLGPYIYTVRCATCPCVKTFCVTQCLPDLVQVFLNYSSGARITVQILAFQFPVLLTIMLIRGLGYNASHCNGSSYQGASRRTSFRPIRY